MAELSPDNPLPTLVAPQAIVFPIMALLASLLGFIPLTAQAHFRSIPVIALLLSLVIGNLANLVNAILWNNDNIASWWDGIGWCQINITLQPGLLQAIIGVSPAILSYLSNIFNTGNTFITPSKTETRLKIAREVVFCIVLPTIVMALTPITLGYNYSIVGLSGCTPNSTKNAPRLLMLSCFAFAAIFPGLFYGWQTIYRLLVYRRQTASLFDSIHSRTSRSRFVRLFIVSMAVLIGSTIFTCINLMAVIGYEFQPWTSFGTGSSVQDMDDSAAVNFQYGHGVVPVWSWVSVCASFIACGVMGIGSGTVVVYKRWIQKIKSLKLSTILRARNT